MSESFDIGPLTWVKDDINQSLDSVLESVDALNANPEETSGLRFAQTHLYQASGALDMVGLAGCKLFCSHLEQLASRLEKKELPVTTETIEAFTKAIKTLKYYIQELLNGSPDIPMRLYPVLELVSKILGENVEESELFFPDTSNTVPKEVASEEYSEEEYQKFIAEQRLQYQKSLLKWMQSKDSDAVNSMYDSLSKVTASQHKSNVKTLWWCASAFVQTFHLPQIADNLSAKKLCRRLDQEFKSLIEGENKPNNSLLRDLLYFIAISNVDNETVLRVKEVFSLDDIVDKKASVLSAQAPSDEDELNVIEELKGLLKALREIWEDVSNSIDFDKIDINADHALVDLDNVLITKFSDKLTDSQEMYSKLSQPAVVGLFNALLQASVLLRDDKSKTTQVALIEVATALHQLDSALTHYQNLDADSIQHLQSEIKRLDAISTGLDQVLTEGRATNVLDRDTIVAVVKDINASLKVVEQALDTYFRAPEDKTTLSLTPAPLKQVAAIFEMLNLPTPTKIIRACSQYIQYFQKDSYYGNQDDFELIAESLSMIGLYANEMPNVRAESTKALEGELERLNAALASTGMVFEEDAVTELSPEESHELAKVTTEKEERTTNTIADKAFDEELQDIYLTEAEEVLALIAQNLQALRVNETDYEPLVEVRRSFHTLKGSGRTVGLVAQAEIAASVEKFLNGVLDKKEILNSAQIKALEQITAAFADWAAELRANNVANLDQVYWLEKAKEITDAKDKTTGDSKQGSKEPDPYVLISGKHKISRQLYEIFLNESMNNLTLVEQDVVKLTDHKTTAPEKEARHAVHTLASNALAAGFKPLGELCRALENWLDEVTQNWTPDSLELYANTTKAIANMWQSASELKMPKAQRALVKLLKEATEKATENKQVSEVVDHVLYDEQIIDEDIAEDVDRASVETTNILPDTQEEHADSTITDVQTQEAPVIKQIDANSKINTKGVNPELLEMFVEEANELLPEIGKELRAWKVKPKVKTHSDVLQRSLHTLKGSARMASQPDIGTIAHELEEYILKISKKIPTSRDFDAMFVELDKMAAYFDSPDALDEPALGAEEANVVEDDDALHVARAIDRKSQFLRMRAEVLDRLINEAGEVSIIRSRIDREMAGFKQSSNDLTDSLIRLRSYLRELEIEAETQMQSRMNILQEANESFDPLEFDRFTRLQELTRMIAESVNDVSTIQSGLLSNLDQTEAALQQQNRMNRYLQQGLLGVRMLPFKQISERMQRIVRQTARELNKTVDLVIEGETTEIDRGVLDRIGAPLEHLLRNAVAHGIENKSKRQSNGKDYVGKV
ncbi:MAG TPA: Hpt domain-containing protein, partial [Methylophilaceae bacterium]|nr:Hpt domain-containing protein [Methylophilaceae bacterium]